MVDEIFRAPLFNMSHPTAATPSVYRQLADALRGRLAVIADREAYARDPLAHLQQLQSASERITALGGQLPAPVDRQFAHYLERCSYDKALAWLDEHAEVS